MNHEEKYLEMEMTEQAFHQLLKNQEYNQLSEWLVEHCLDVLQRTDVHPYVKSQTKNACQLILNKHQNLSFEDFLRGTLKATDVLTRSC
jgi:hypothetical protein